MKYWIYKGILICLLLLSGPFSLVYGQKTVVLEDSIESIVLGPHTATLADPVGQWNLQDILAPTLQQQFSPNISQVFSVGFTKTVYWFRFTLENPSSIPQEWVLDYPYRTMDWVELHRPLPSGEYQMTRVGDIFPVSARDIPHEHYLFKLNLPPQTRQTYYFRANSNGGAMVVPLILSRPIAFSQNVRPEQLVWGIFFGIMGILVLYSFFQFLLIRDQGYLFYSLTMLFGSTAYLIMSGWGKLYFWAETEFPFNNLLPQSFVITTTFLLLYYRTLLDTQKNLPRTDWILEGSIVVAGGLLFAFFFMPYGVQMQLANLFVFWTLIFGVPTCFLRYRQNYEPALYPLIGVSAMVITAGYTMYQTTYGTAPIGVISFPSILGILIDLLMLSFALSSRYKILRTEKEEVQQEKLAMQETVVSELKRADQLKDYFLANTSHELSTPLHGIIGICQAMERTDYVHSPEEQQRNLQLITNSARRLSHLVNDILDFSRMKNQDLRLKQRSVEVQGAIHLVSQLCEPSLGQKPIKIVKELPKTTLYVNADEDRLQQILFNLLGNAIKFTHEGQIVLKVEKQNNQALVSVSDTGIGISPENQQEIFKPFIQADGSISREYGGTGLGLAISQQLVSLHGSELAVESALDKGTTFSFRLPIASSGGDSPSPIPLEVASTSVQSPQGNALEPNSFVPPSLPNPDQEAPTLLIVDDEPLNLEILKYQLIQEGYQVQAASDGIQALEIVRQTVPDLILLDLMMPRMNGYEVCQTVRETYTAAELPIILLTAKGQMADLVAGLRVGANDYLTKPFYQEELLARIKSQLAQRHAVEVLQENQQLTWKIHQTQQAEAALKLSEKRLSQILDRSNEAILAVNHDGMIIFCNQAIVEPLGYATDQLLNQPVTQLLPEKTDDHCLQWPPDENVWTASNSPQSSVLKKQNGELWPCMIWGGELNLDEETWIFTFAPPQELSPNVVPMMAQWMQSLQQNRTRLQGIIEVLHELPEVLLHSQPGFLDHLNELDHSLGKLSDWVQPSQQENLFEKLLVQVMNHAIVCWEAETQKSLVDLAEESGLWAVNIDGDRLRARALERYMDLKKLPKQPRWRNVIKTGHFVLTQSGASSNPKTQLQQSMDHLLQIIHQRNLSPPVTLEAGS